MKESDSGYDTIRHVDNEYAELYAQPPVSGPDVFKKVVVPSIDKVYIFNIIYKSYTLYPINSFLYNRASCAKLLLPKMPNSLWMP